RKDDFRMSLGLVDKNESLCRSCLRCGRECPKEALSVPPNQEYKHQTFGAWTAEILTALIRQAETGKVPVSGQGYRGKFAGPGFDGIWTDMSEIVRPTRDGIHGREYISTAIVLGSRPASLDPESRTTVMSRMIELPVPFLFDLTVLPSIHSTARASILSAAHKLDTIVFVNALDFDQTESSALQIPVLQPSQADLLARLEDPVMIELCDGDGFDSAFHEIKRNVNGTLFSVRIPFDADRALDLVYRGAHVLHLITDPHGQTPIGHVSTALRTIHTKLVNAGVRDRVTILAGGSVAAAEHLPKTVLLGADGVTLDLTLLVAMELWKGGPVRENVSPFMSVDTVWGTQRICNLMAAWRDQLLEILGAMGMREVRRLRGEVGRGLFYEELLREFKEVLTSPPATVPKEAEPPRELIPQISAPVAPVNRNFHNELSKFNVKVTDACIH